MNQPSNEYWAERFAQLEALAHELGIEIYVEVQKGYQRAVKELIRELAEWYSVILDDDVSYAEVKKLLTNKQADDFRMDVDDYIRMASQAEIAESWQKTLEKAAARQRITRLDSIMIRLQQHIEMLFGKQEELLYDGLQKLYEQEYYHTAFEIEKGFGVGHEFGGVNTGKLEAILKKPWAPDGANFSDRVWKHKENLVNTLKQELVRAVIRGDDFRTATKNLSDKMNVSQSAAGRLVMTESAFFASKSMADCMEEFDVEEYQFVATLDMRTSTMCRDMDKKVFKMKDFAPGTTAPPLHCHCRSHISPYFADAAISERVARGQDGKTYFVPSNMNYRDWERVYIKKEISLEDWKKGVSDSRKDVIINLDDNIHLEQAKKRDHKIMINPIAISKVPLVKVKGLSTAECERIQMEHKDLLRIAMEDNDSNEVLSIMSLKNGSTVKVKGSEDGVNPGSNPMAVALSNQAGLNELAFLHNHPSTNNFSLTDIMTFLRQPVIGLMSVVTNQGKVHILKKGDKYDFSRNWNQLVKSLEDFSAGRKDDSQAVQQFLKNCNKRGVLYESST